MLFSEQRRRVAHALRPSTVRNALKGAKQSIKARLTRSSPVSVIPSSVPEAVTSTLPTEIRTETSGLSSVAQTTGAIAAASLGFGLVCVATRPLSSQPVPVCARVDTSSASEIPDTEETDIASVKEEAPKAVAPSIETTLVSPKVKPLDPLLLIHN